MEADRKSFQAKPRYGNGPERFAPGLEPPVAAAPSTSNFSVFLAFISMQVEIHIYDFAHKLAPCLPGTKREKVEFIEGLACAAVYHPPTTSARSANPARFGLRVSRLKLAASDSAICP